MIQRVIITSEAEVSIKPLVEAALRNEKKLILHGVERTRQRLAAFEEQFGMASFEFEQRFNANEFEETLDLIDWLMEIQALRLLEEQFQALRDARLD